ncbi:tol-pal system protein YbgF [Aliiglaciecola sp. CAU 1673]|uniref:tol-pal system protein YbgF n=1 Tax=Aliiglaciecola sp. CAU 1673 TaxID=3032595 RepID=UPI0023D9F102|nr:tol-pal system protein YbgF [Aliiglaciecola sp. CAU 1673]MDF2177204.1 tol-pal system protein YbgF [Aliiglaciecola sp. CAU 1673]
MMKRSLAVVCCLSVGAAAFAAPAPVTDVSRGSVDSRLTALERMVEARTDSQHRIQQQLDVMQQEVNELRGAVELHTHKLEQILERQRELYQEIDRRMEGLQAQQPAPNYDVANDMPAPSPQDMSSGGEAEAYDKAVNLILRDKRYDDAIPAFENFLQTYPSSSYAANAYYWLGQLQFNKQAWDKATQQFERVVNNYPDSNKRADSLLKMGMIAQNQGNLARAQQLFERVIKEFPNSSARKLAEPRLNAIKQPR